ncbi:MAG: zinc transporter ZupT, partial [Chthoniobacterales bacterium]
MTNEHLLTAFILTLLAGLGTVVGSCIAFLAKRTDHRFLSVTTGFSAGVMLYVSFVEIFPKGEAALLGAGHSNVVAAWINAAAFFAGILIIGLIDNLIPAAENPHETRTHEEAETLLHAQDKPAAKHRHDHKLMRMGLFTALAIGIHNFPEGLATFLVALQNPGLGVAIAVAIALHNIPEGMSVSVPIYYATGSRKKAFIYSALSGLAEPVGAIVAYAVFVLLAGGGTVIPGDLVGPVFGAVAGIMVYISLDELLPTSRAYG